MSKLTSERVNGIKAGYWSAAKKDELVQKLGAIEHLAPRLLKKTCIGVCLHSPEDDREHDEVCRGCPVYELTMLVEGIQND